MNRLLVLVLCVVFSAGIAAVAFAATDSDTVTITVNYVDLLEVPETAALTLTTATAGATSYTQGTLTQTNGLKYSHNSTTAKKITASAVADGGNPANDITLTAAIAGGAGANAVVNAGADQSDVLLWGNIIADGYTKDVAWTADATLAATKAGANVNQNYVWTVTFTSLDN